MRFIEAEEQKIVHELAAMVGTVVDAGKIAASPANQVLRVELPRLLLSLADLVSSKIGCLPKSTSWSVNSH